MKVSLKLNSIDKLKSNHHLQKMGKVQKYIDSEVLRRSDKYVPFLTGNLKHSGISGTKIGSGTVVYNAPYARENYYHNAGMGKQGMRKHNSHNKYCLRGPYWFERMKNANLQEIIDGAKKIAKGK